jgi:hypothetical protein
MSNVILINPFELPANAVDDQFLAGWDRAAEMLRDRPGFAGTRLHRAISPDARFRFINVAEWESPRHFAEAVGDEAFRRLAQNAPPNYPALYEIARAI